MLLRRCASLLGSSALLLLQQPTATSAQVASNASSLLNGWYSCAEFTFSSDGSSPSDDAECAIYTAPLCYPGVCTDAKKRTVEIFVKRIPASANAATAPNVWFLQGGPGAGSTAMESAMVSLHEQMSGKVNVYTMDHRGTGRSTLLNCVAAQATTSGSPLGSDISVSEVPACAKDIEVKYGGDLSAFSVTSAATDVSTVISQFQTRTTGKTFVYGVSYGTALVERLMHLDNDAIAGYVLDGIATTSGAPVADFEYFSMWDADFGDVGAYYMGFCTKDPLCAVRFPGTSLAATLTTVLESFDAKPTSTCAALVRDVTADSSSKGNTNADKASDIVRQRLGSLFQRDTTRTLIPVLAYRLHRCSAVDVDVLTHFFNVSASALSPAVEEDAFDSTLLYYVIVFSEMWETPTPSLATMRQRFSDTAICNGGTAASVALYCAFSKEPSAACAALKVPTYTAAPLTYRKDAYWNAAATLPTTASVLLLSSKMDPQTPHKYAERLFAAIQSNTKELVTFEHAAHGTLWTTPVATSRRGTTKRLTCGMQLLLSYVAGGGDLQKLDRSCVAAMPPLSFDVDDDATRELLSTTDAFDGAFDASLSASDKAGTDAGRSDSDAKQDGTSYKGAFIACLVLFVVALAAAAGFAFCWLRQRRRTRNAAAAAANAATGGVQSTAGSTSGGCGDITDNSPTTAYVSRRR